MADGDEDGSLTRNPPWMPNAGRRCAWNKVDQGRNWTISIASQILDRYCEHPHDQLWEGQRDRGNAGYPLKPFIPARCRGCRKVRAATNTSSLLTKLPPSYRVPDSPTVSLRTLALQHYLVPFCTRTRWNLPDRFRTVPSGFLSTCRTQTQTELRSFRSSGLR